MKRWKKGCDELDEWADFVGYKITENDPDAGDHYNKIVVYDDEKLRDDILAFLMGREETH